MRPTPASRRSGVPSCTKRFANLAERTNAGRAGELDEIIGYHLEQAFRYRAELGPLSEDARALGETRLRHPHHGGTARDGTRRLAGRCKPRSSVLCDSSPVSTVYGLEIMIELSEALQGTGALAEAQRVLDEAAAEAEAAGDDRVRARASVEAAFTQLHTWEGPLDMFVPLSEEAAAVFEASGDDVGLSRASDASRVHHLHPLPPRGDGGDSRPRNRTRTSGPTVVASWPTCSMSAHAPASRPDDGDGCDGVVRGRQRAECRRPRPRRLRSRRAGGPRSHAWTIRRGPHASAEAERILLDLGRTLALAFVRADAGAVELLAGNAGTASAILRSACDTLVEIGERGNLRPTQHCLRKRWRIRVTTTEQTSTRC